MHIHYSTLQLSRRINLCLPIPGIIALATFLLTLSPGVYPGYSSVLTASAAGLLPPSGADHPVFAWVLRLIASHPILALPVALNLFSALCGVLCAVVLYHLVANLVLIFACETKDGSTKEAEGMSRTFRELSPEMALFNRRMLPVAVTAGLVAALLLIFMVPLWSASTRVHPAPFDLLLALAAFDLLLICEAVSSTYARIFALVLSCFLFAVGVVESAVFLILLPCYAFFTASALFFSSRRKTVFSALSLGGAAGLVCALFAFFHNGPAPSSTGLRTLVLVGAYNLASHHYHEFLSFFAQTGWLLLLAQTTLPALVLLFGASSFFEEKPRGRLPALIVLTLSSIPTLLNLPFSPMALFQRVGHLPVFGGAVVASATAIVIAACYKIILTPVDPRTAEDVAKAKGVKLIVKKGSEKIALFCASCLLVTLILLGTLAPWRSFRDTDTRTGAFADEIARDMIAQMGSRTWLASNGQLDTHLLVQALLLKHPLTLVPLRPRISPGELSKLDAAIARDPVFEGQNRTRLQNALSIGPTRFIMEWFKTDPKSAEHAMVFASPDIWTACGARAVPEGLAFGGAFGDASPDVSMIVEQNRRFFDLSAPLLVPRERETAAGATLRSFLRVRTGFAANELGVFLEAASRHEEAYQAYRRASRIDPMNISAAVNAYVLATSKKIHPEEVDRLRKTIKTCSSGAPVKNMTLMGILQTYGTIRQTDFYRQQSALWSASGASLAAADKIEKASALSESMDASSLVGKAAFYIQAGMPDKAEECCKVALEKDPVNGAAMSTLATLALARGRLDEAEAWLGKASRNGVKQEPLLYQTITLALLRKDDAKAQSMLERATKEYPTDVRYWILLADVLLRQNATQATEFEVLPAMQKALGNQDHYLVHAVRGFLLRKKGTANYKEARRELLRSVSMNALQPDVWSVIFELDLALGNPEFTEADAQSQLTVNPDHALANYLLGAANLTRGAVKRSEDFLRRSIEKRPTAPACNDLAENLRQQKRFDEAEPFARQALAIQSDFAPALDTLASILLETQRYNEAALVSEQAIKLSPKTPVFQLTLLRVRVKQNDDAGMSLLLDELKASKISIPADLQQEIQRLRRASASVIQPKG